MVMQARIDCIGGVTFIEVYRREYILYFYILYQLVYIYIS